jgi:hypothetical protein
MTSKEYQPNVTLHGIIITFNIRTSTGHCGTHAALTLCLGLVTSNNAFANDGACEETCSLNFQGCLVLPAKHFSLQLSRKQISASLYLTTLPCIENAEHFSSIRSQPC